MKYCTNEKLPNFLILGAAKAGTTSLHAMLRQHREIFMSHHKEPQFFFSDAKYKNGLEYYVNTYFQESGGYSVRGEASPSYFHAPDRVAPRIKADLDVDSLKFVVLLRDPVERAWSHYQHRRRVCAETCTFSQALELEQQRLTQSPTQWVGYFRDGLYGELVSRWLNHFPLDKFLFIDYQDFKTDWERALKRICQHIGVTQNVEWSGPAVINTSGVAKNRLLMRLIQKPRPELAFIKSIVGTDRIARTRTALNRWNTRSAPKPSMDAEVKKQLRSKYIEDICQLERLLRQDFKNWKSGT